MVGYYLWLPVAYVDTGLVRWKPHQHPRYGDQTKTLLALAILLQAGAGAQSDLPGWQRRPFGCSSLFKGWRHL